MTNKERFLKINTYEEYLKQRETFKDLKPDREIIQHLSKIFPKPYGGKEELYKTRPEDGKKRIIGK